MRTFPARFLLAVRPSHSEWQRSPLLEPWRLQRSKYGMYLCIYCASLWGENSALQVTEVSSEERPDCTISGEHLSGIGKPCHSVVRGLFKDLGFPLCTRSPSLSMGAIGGASVRIVAILFVSVILVAAVLQAERRDCPERSRRKSPGSTAGEIPRPW